MSRTGAFYDSLETRSADAREASILAALPEIVARAKRQTAHYRATLRDVEPMDIASRAALATLPVTRKAALADMGRTRPPFGGLAVASSGSLRRIFASPGPIYEPEGAGPDYWRTARALFAAGLRRGDTVQNCFSYHFTPAGAMYETGAEALGCTVIPAGAGNTDQQAQAVADLRPKGYIGTPDFLKAILERGDALGLDCSSVTLAHVSGGPFLPPLKTAYADRGIAVTEGYGTADVGLIAYQSAAREGLILDEHILVEIVRPGTGDPVTEGETGEVVVTSFSRVYPLLRFATGDLSAMMPGTSPCGRTNRRIRGWLGRADQTTKVKGMFVHPAQVAEVLRRHPPCRKARLVVTEKGGTDAMTLTVETAQGGDDLARALAETLRAVTKLRGEVVLVPPDSLPDDGKVIEDARRHA
ncbi:MAG: phenylacetate--CoA ligase family protein [Inquilinaceae bacterium]